MKKILDSMKKHPKRRHTKRKTQPFAVVMIIFCTLLTSFGQLFLKMGVNKLQLNLPALISNWPLLLGLFLYGLSAIVMISALKFGELSILYPFIALSFIWVMLLSIFFLHESVSAWNWFGVAAILLGVSMIGKGGSVAS